MTEGKGAYSMCAETAMGRAALMQETNKRLHALGSLRKPLKTQLPPPYGVAYKKLRYTSNTCIAITFVRALSGLGIWTFRDPPLNF